MILKLLLRFNGLMEESQLKIANGERIGRILRRICQASLQVIIRTDATSSVAIKGRAVSLITEGNARGVRISNNSEKGMAYLTDRLDAHVEFIMMSTKVIFTSRFLLREQSSIVLTIPEELISIERRKNARYFTTPDLSAFLGFSLFRPAEDDVTSAPFFLHYRDVGALVALSDLSLGGVCAVTRFPALNAVLRRGMIDDAATLHLPMQAPIPLAIEVRWFKKIREHIKTADGSSKSIRTYKCGLEFKGKNEAVEVSIRQFLQQLSQAGAI